MKKAKTLPRLGKRPRRQRTDSESDENEDLLEQLEELLKDDDPAKAEETLECMIKILQDVEELTHPLSWKKCENSG